MTSVKKIEELQSLHEKLNLMLDFLPVIVQGQFRHLIQNAFNDGNLTGMRMVERDFKNWIKDLRGEKRKLLNQALLEKFGEGIGDNTAALKRVDKILARGIIKTKGEYRIISEFVEEHWESQEFAARIEDGNKLMAAFPSQEM